MNFGAFLRERREAAGWSIYRLAKETGISETVIHAYEKKGSQPTLDKADRLLQALGASLTIGKQ